MKEYTDIFPASSSNAITKEYYYTLLDQINRGTCSQKICSVVHKNGSYEYCTYHLITVI